MAIPAVNIPRSPFIEKETGRISKEWLAFLLNPSFLTLNITTANITGVLSVVNGGTGNNTPLTDGQLWVGSTSNPPNPKTITGDAALTTTGALTINTHAVINSKLAQMPTLTIKGNNTGSVSDPLDLTAAQVQGMLALSTRQTFITGVALTYNTPANCRQLRIRMIGGGAGGGGTGVGAGDGVNGVNSTFSGGSLVAGGGSGGFAGTHAGGPTAGAGGSPTNGSPGFFGNAGFPGETLANASGGNGGAGTLGGLGAGGVAVLGGGAPNNSGGGGGGAGATGTPVISGAGGGSGAYVEFLINSPLGTYTYTVGAGGNGGAAGTLGLAGGAGGSGILIVDEYY
jgi:hypothetical protein